MSHWRLWVTIGVIVILLAGAWWFVGMTGGPDAPAREPGTADEDFYALGEPTEGVDIGQRAPELVGGPGQEEALLGLDGEPITLAALRGRPLWLVFWATWCPPCQSETPDLQRAFEAHASDGLRLIAIDVQEPAEIVADYMATYDLTYTAALDPSGAIMRAYGVFGLPTHYFIDEDGIVRDRVYGPLSFDQMEERLTGILVPDPGES
jgi:thiol-disulfide isomerase/thioredoxin